MNYRKMLKVYKSYEEMNVSNNVPEKVETPVVEEQPVKEKIVYVKDESTDKNVNSIMEMLTDIKNQIKVPSGTEPSTLLNEIEVEVVLNILLTLQDKCFSMTPLSPDLVKAFVWNIPRSMYDLAIENYENNGIPALNPLYWFYMFCIDTTELSKAHIKLAFAHAVTTAVGSITDEDFESMVSTADDYELSFGVPVDDDDNDDETSSWEVIEEYIDDEEEGTIPED